MFGIYLADGLEFLRESLVYFPSRGEQAILAQSTCMIESHEAKEQLSDYFTHLSSYIVLANANSTRNEQTKQMFYF